MAERIENVSLDQLRSIYDKAYSYEGLMGTDFDENYDSVTKTKLCSYIEPVSEKRILDVGTGIGNLWRYMPACTGQGYVLDPSQIGVHRALTTHSRLSGTVSISENLPYHDETFDAVISADTMEHTFEPDQALAEIYRVLKPGGVFSASFPMPDSLRKWGWNQLRYDFGSARKFVRLAMVVMKRTLLFGRADFQPIDRDIAPEGWLALMETAGFTVAEHVEWPQNPRSPIVFLVKAIK